MNRSHPRALTIVLALASVLPLAFVGRRADAAQTVKCDATKDTWISACGHEKDFNMGRAGKIKMKFTQEFGLADFDVSRLAGKRITKAWISIHNAGGSKWKANRGADLKWLTVSTVSHGWVEGKSPKYARDEAGHGATYNESSYTRDDWGWPGARVVDVTLGNGNTLRDDGQLEATGGGWYRMPIDPKLVGALVSGASHGLLLMDGSGDVVLNQYIHSREGRHGPYLTVGVAGDDATAPAPARSLAMVPDVTRASRRYGAATVTLTVPKGAFAYRVTLDGNEVDRWQIPFATSAGARQSFTLLDLDPDREYTLSLCALDASGNSSEPVEVAGRSSPAVAAPALPAFGFRPTPGAPKRLGPASVWAAPELVEVDPVSGEALFERASGEYRSANAVWDGSRGLIRLAAARGEIVSFQLVIEGEISNVTIEVSDLAGPGTLSRTGSRLWRNWYVAGQPEYAIALRGPVSCPMPDNAVAGQQNQSVTVDYHVPLDTAPGGYTGTVTLRAGDERAELALAVDVYDVALPETVFFNPELNCYGGPYRAGTEGFKAAFRVAHYNRCTINRVPYSQSGRTHDDWLPGVDRAGRVSDWSQFDANLGGLLDGSWFRDNPRSGVPVATFYLPLFEGWPLDYRDHYRPGCDVPSGGNGREVMTKHHMQAKPLEVAMDRAYQDAFIRCTSDFVRHAKEKGWTSTIFQMYQNNKGWKSNNIYTLWTLDEPYKYADWHAISFWAGLYKRGAGDPEFFTPSWHERYFREGGVAAMKRDRPTFVYRGDISRGELQGSACDGLMGILYGGGGQRLMRNTKERGPMILCTYGACPNNKDNTWSSAAWCLKAYASDNDGVLPWQSIGGPESLVSGDRGDSGNALIVVNDKRFGAAVPSLRLHALRRGAQDCELLRLLQIQMGWGRAHIAALVSQRVPLGGEHRVTDAAAAMDFGRLSARGFVELKEGVLRMLSQGGQPLSRATNRTAVPASSVAKTDGKPRPQALEVYDMFLQERIALGIAGGQALKYYSPSVRKTLVVLGVRDGGTLEVKTRGAGLRYFVEWSRLTLAEKKSLAVNLVREGEELDHELAAFYLLAVGESAEARRHLEASGDGAERVRSSF